MIPHLDEDGVPPDGSLPADRPEHHGNLDAVVRSVARTLRAMHDADASAGGAVDPQLRLPSGWSAIDIAIQERLDADLIRAAELPEPYCRYTADRLVEIWREGRPDHDELVVCHGRPVLSSFHVDHGEVVAIGDLGGMRRADRHLDLAIVHQSLHRVLGPEAVFLFYEAYGDDPDLIRLDHHLLAALLLEGPIWL